MAWLLSRAGRTGSRHWRANSDGEALAADLTNAAELKLVEDRIAAAEDLELLVNNAASA